MTITEDLHPQADLIRQAVTGDGETGVPCAMRNAVANLLDAGWTLHPPTPA